MLTSEQLKTVRRIQIRTRHLVSELFAGQYQSAFKGQGVEFAEVRAYQPGDDVRTIDWNVTARSGEPFVKNFVEERELTVMLLVDSSASTVFGSETRLKRELAAEVAAAFAMSAVSNNDKVGLIIFSDEVELAVPPRKGTRHVARVTREILTHTPAGGGTDIAGALQYMDRVTHRRSVLLVLSDFLDSGYEAALSRARSRHDAIAIVLEDPRDYELPDIGLAHFSDPESGGEILVDTSEKRVREAYARETDRRRAERDRALRTVGVDRLDLQTNKDYAAPLELFFRTRRGRRR